ncbi:MAG: hypothetical protein Kow00122_15700 [Thermoleophilia bacterium]
MMTYEEAVLELRRDPRYAALLRDAYLEGNPAAGAARFAASAEFKEIRTIAGNRLAGGIVVDVGAGTGIATYAFAVSGASLVYAVEPDPSDEVGRGAIARACAGLEQVRLLDFWGESMPIADGTADIVYARQVLHHARDLDELVAECARVLKPGGLFLACREHVVDDERQLRAFLQSHPIHRLAGCEGAFPLGCYEAAIERARLRLRRILGPWDSVINAFPAARSENDLQQRHRQALRSRLGPLAGPIAGIPLVKTVLNRLLDAKAQAVPGRLYTFVAVKPIPPDRGGTIPPARGDTGTERW